MSASLGRRLGDGWSLTAAAGVILDGEMLITHRRIAPRVEDVEAGWLASLQLSRQWVAAGGRRPFVSTSVAFSAAGSATEVDDRRRSMTSLDLRAALVVGRTFLEVWTPYVAARVFGGPVFWSFAGQDVSGGSRDHYQLGVGSLLALEWGFTLTVDWSMLGDRTLSVGLGYGVP